MTEPTASGPLRGLRVVDCSRGTAGPRATGLLADYGAEVIWVEPPGGDPYRKELAVPYSGFNRGKRSVVLDLRSDDGRERLFDLLATADVFVRSWRPGVAERLGLGFDGLRARFPRLVVCSITGFGNDGPYRDVPGYEALVHALAGTMAEQPGHREGPIFQALPFASIGAATLAAIGTTAALLRREDDGTGRHVETSMLDGALAYLSMLWGDTDQGEDRPEPGSHKIVPRSFLCADGEYVGVNSGAVGAFGRLLKVLGLEDRIDSSASGIDMGTPLTPEERAILDSVPVDIFATKPSAYWVETLREAEVCCIEHLPPTRVFDTPQARHNEMVTVVDDPVLGRVEQVAPPAKFSATPPIVQGPAPGIGQHTDAVFASLKNEPRRACEPPGAVDDRPLLEGIRILDLGAFYAGPYSSRLLADLGAEVIKLEPLAGDPVRGMAVVYRSASAGKRSIALDLKHAGTRDALEKLLEWCDILHHNQRPGAAERLGVDYESVRARRPDAIYVYAPGWGSSGPDRLRQSFAPMLSGYVGVGLEVAGQFNPPLFPAGNEDPGNGLIGAVAMMMGLLHRRRTGEGQFIENPQLNATMTHTAHMVRTADGEALGANRLDPLQMGFSALERLYQTADGWLCIVATRQDHFEALASVLGLDLAGDARFSTRSAREANDYPLSELLDTAFRERATADWLAELAESGVPAAEPVPYNCTNFLRNPENHRSGRVAEVQHPKYGTVRELAVLMRVSDAKPAAHRLAPDRGEHTDEILRWLGWDDRRIEAIRAAGAVV
ncbi:MAG: CoA transferase [Proteobacteria bacterium]|nr:CoA transferase [Pseudomonadota bacterium]